MPNSEGSRGPCDLSSRPVAWSSGPSREKRVLGEDTALKVGICDELGDVTDVEDPHAICRPAQRDSPSLYQGITLCLMSSQPRAALSGLSQLFYFHLDRAVPCYQLFSSHFLLRSEQRAYQDMSTHQETWKLLFHSLESRSWREQKPFANRCAFLRS